MWAGRSGQLGGLEHRKDPFGQAGRGGEFGTAEDGDLGLAALFAADFDRQFAQPLIAHHLAPDQEGVAGGQGGGEILFDLAQWQAAHAVAQADLQRFRRGDRADVHADRARGPRVAERPEPVAQHQPLPAVISAQRIAAGRAEIETGVEIGAGQGGVGSGAGDFGIQRVGVDGPGAGGDQDMLAEHVTGAGAARFAVKVVVAHGFQSGLAFDHLEAVGGHQQRLRGRIIAVVGAADALDEAFHILRRADLDDQIDIAPVNAEVQRPGANNGAQLPRDHRRLDPLALFAGETAVMDCDRQAVGVGHPEIAEEQFGLRPRVVEDQRDAVAADLIQHRADGIAPAAPGPRGGGVGVQHGDVGIGARIGQKDRAGIGVAGEVARDGGGVFDGR